MSAELTYPYISLIPYRVAVCRELSDKAKLHYGCLVGLSQKEGYCWATDEELSKIQEVDVRSVKRWHKALEEHGFIKRVTRSVTHINKKGKSVWRKRRRVYVDEGFKNVDTSWGHVSNGTLESPSMKGTLVSPSIERDTDVPSIKSKSLKSKSLKRERGDKPPNPPVSSSDSSSPEKVSYGSDDLVKMTTTEYNKLFTEYGEIRLDEIIEELNNYIGSKGDKYKSHYSTLKSWFNRKRRDVQPKTSHRKGTKLHFDGENTEDTWTPTYATADDL